MRHYNVQRVPAGFSLMFGAGALSGLLGIGSGAVKVLAMDQAMKIPFKVSTTTSNFMIGVTAAASAGVYLEPWLRRSRLAMPVMLGVLAGSMLGARILMKAETKMLRIVFSVVIAVARPANALQRPDWRNLKMARTTGVGTVDARSELRTSSAIFFAPECHFVAPLWSHVHREE